MLRLILAQLRCDLLEVWLRPARLLRQGIALTTVIIGLLGLDQLLGPQRALLPGGDFLLFGALGVMGVDLMWQATVGFSDRVYGAWRVGLLDACATSPTPVWQLTLTMAIWPLLSAMLRATALGLTVMALRPTAIHLERLPDAALVFALATIGFVALGALSATLSLWLRHKDPVARVLTGLCALLGGALYPPESLPGALSALAPVLPLASTLEALRATILEGQPLSATHEPLWTLLLAAGAAPLLGALALALLRHRLRTDHHPE